MGEELALAMEQRRTRWESRGLWSQWFDAGKAAGLIDRHAARYASDMDESVRRLESRIEADRTRLVSLVNLGAAASPGTKEDTDE